MIVAISLTDFQVMILKVNYATNAMAIKEKATVDSVRECLEVYNDFKYNSRRVRKN